MGRAPYCCHSNIGLKKGPWTPEEDQKLISYIHRNGHGSWRALAQQAGLSRCGKSCRLRWTNYLRPDIKRGKFSAEEEQTILQMHALLGNRWSTIASHLPGRTDNEIKNYWNTHLKKRLLRMGIDPVTHRPAMGFYDSLRSNSFISSTLARMMQCETSRLQADAGFKRDLILDLARSQSLQTDAVISDHVSSGILKGLLGHGESAWPHLNQVGYQNPTPQIGSTDLNSLNWEQLLRGDYSLSNPMRDATSIPYCLQDCINSKHFEPPFKLLEHMYPASGSSGSNSVSTQKLPFLESSSEPSLQNIPVVPCTPYLGGVSKEQDSSTSLEKQIAFPNTQTVADAEGFDLDIQFSGTCSGSFVEDEGLFGQSCNLINSTSSGLQAALFTKDVNSSLQANQNSSISIRAEEDASSVKLDPDLLAPVGLGVTRNCESNTRGRSDKCGPIMSPGLLLDTFTKANTSVLSSVSNNQMHLPISMTLSEDTSDYWNNMLKLVGPAASEAAS